MNSLSADDARKLADLAEKMRKRDWTGMGQVGFNEYARNSNMFAGPHGRFLKMTGDSAIGAMSQLARGDTYLDVFKTQGRELSTGIMGLADSTGASGFGFGRDFAGLAKSRGWQGIKEDFASGAVETAISSLGHVTSNGSNLTAHAAGAAMSAMPIYGKMVTEGVGFLSGVASDAKKRDPIEIGKDAAEIALGVAGAATGPVGEIVATGASAALEVADAFRKRNDKPKGPKDNLTGAGRSNKFVNHQFTTGDFST